MIHANKKERKRRQQKRDRRYRKRKMGCNNSTSESEVKWQYTARSELRGTAEGKRNCIMNDNNQMISKDKNKGCKPWQMQTMADASMAALLKKHGTGIGRLAYHNRKGKIAQGRVD